MQSILAHDPSGFYKKPLGATGKMLPCKYINDSTTADITSILFATKKKDCTNVDSKIPCKVSQQSPVSESEYITKKDKKVDRYVNTDCNTSKKCLIVRVVTLTCGNSSCKCCSLAYEDQNLFIWSKFVYCLECNM